jgi:hypothetical protein
MINKPLLILSKLGLEHSQLFLDFLQHNPHRKCKVLFEDGAVIWEGIKNTVELHKENEVEILFESTKERNDSFEIWQNKSIRW